MAKVGLALTAELPRWRVRFCILACYAMRVLPQSKRDKMAERVWPHMKSWISSGIRVSVKG